MKKTTKILHIGLHRPEAEIVEKMEEAGHQVSEIVRGLIREHGAREFPATPAYAEALKLRALLKQKELDDKKAFDSMSNEEYAVRELRGQLRGQNVVFRVASGMEVPVALHKIKEFSRTGSDLVVIHNQLLDRTFVGLRGESYTDKQYEQVWAGWDAMAKKYPQPTFK